MDQKQRKKPPEAARRRPAPAGKKASAKTRAHDPTVTHDREETGNIGVETYRFDSDRQARQMRRDEVHTRLDRQYGRVKKGGKWLLNHVHPLTLLLGLAVLALSVVLLTSSVKVTVLSDQISSAQSEYEDLKKENQDLRVAQENRYDLQEIKEYVSNTLGMVPMDSAQLEYIELDTDEVITVVGDEQTETADGLLGWLQDFWALLTQEPEE